MDTWIYISPHLDDAALSCGGLIWEQSHAGNPVEVWTICAGDPPSVDVSEFASMLHQRWQTGAQAVSQRRAEDRLSCELLGAAWRHFSIPDCIYRLGPEGQPLYASEESLFGCLHPHDEKLVRDLAVKLNSLMINRAESTGGGGRDSRGASLHLVCPLTVGNHVDHQMTRRAAEMLGRPLWYYVDYPYAAKETAESYPLLRKGLEPVVFPISENGLEAWGQAIAAHASQVGGFWPDFQTMQAEIGAYAESAGGVRLWRGAE
ncbi:MAG: PIG-L family deacetylase [Chloroflexota bacterium]|nr:MAG: PIG-L family deacetylase [Chloroflexota bacterium]